MGLLWGDLMLGTKNPAPWRARGKFGYVTFTIYHTPGELSKRRLFYPLMWPRPEALQEEHLEQLARLGRLWAKFGRREAY